jgi:3-hydroxyacyl-CoA dehydrogenase
MPPVEIIPGVRTSKETVSIAKEFVLKAGKTPVICKKEVPGFLINRLQFALFSEATSLLEEGVATAEEIDTAIRTGEVALFFPSGRRTGFGLHACLNVGGGPG